MGPRNSSSPARFQRTRSPVRYKRPPSPSACSPDVTKDVAEDAGEDAAKTLVEKNRIGTLPPVELPLILQSREYEPALTPVAGTVGARRHVRAIEQVACIERSRPAVQGRQRAPQVITQCEVDQRCRREQDRVRRIAV